MSLEGGTETYSIADHVGPCMGCGLPYRGGSGGHCSNCLGLTPKQRTRYVFLRGQAETFQVAINKACSSARRAVYERLLVETNLELEKLDDETGQRPR